MGESGATTKLNLFQGICNSSGFVYSVVQGNLVGNYDYSVEWGADYHDFQDFS